MISITETIKLDEGDIRFKFIRSPGPGGQHVNKAATGVQLRFDLAHTACLPDYVRHNLIKLAKSRISSEGLLIINANRFRSQDLNRKDALDRLTQLIREAARKTKSRRATKPTTVSVKRRLETKKRRGKLKQSRQTVAIKSD